MAQQLKVLHSALSDHSVPRYLQVASVLRHRIRDGVWPVGARISTIESLEGEFGVARVTIRQAIATLQKQGLLEARQGRGTFVVGEVGEDRWLRLGAGWSDVLAPIQRNIPHELPLAEGHKPSAPTIREGEGKLAADYVFLRTLQTRKGAPYGLARVHVATHVYQRAPKEFRRRVALAVLRNLPGLRIGRGTQTLTIGEADIETAQHLRISLNAPVVNARVVVVGTGDEVIYVGDITYRGDCVCISIELEGDD